MSDWKKEVADFKRELKIEPSTMTAQALRFGFFGFVGSGKSTTATLFALGITPDGIIGYVDGEGHRSGYAIDVACDLAAKKYGKPKEVFRDRIKIVHIPPPFHPLRVVAAIEAFEDAGAKTVVLDILSQAWDSDGGYLDLKNDQLDAMAGGDEAKRKRSQDAAAAQVKPWTHGKLVNKINHSKCNLVMLFQGKQKYNAAQHKPDEVETPIQESGLTRTAFAVGRVFDEGKVSYRGPATKHTHPALRKILPEGQLFTLEHAEAVLQWSRGAKLDERKELLTELRDLTADIHGWTRDLGASGWAIAKPKLQRYLTDECGIDVLLDSQTADQLRATINTVKRKLQPA